MRVIVYVFLVIFSYSLFAKDLDSKIKIDRKCSKLIEVRNVFHKPGLKYKMSYPQLYCKQKRNCMSKLNDALKTELIRGFDIAISYFESEEGIKHPGYLSLKYTVNCNQLGFVNVEVYDESDLGGAHPFHTYETYLAHINQNKLLTLTDLVYPTSEFWDFLSQEISKSINESSAPMPKKNNFKLIILSDSGVIFIFNEYELGGFYNGMHIGGIPISRIQKFLKPEIKKIYNLN